MQASGQVLTRTGQTGWESAGIREWHLFIGATGHICYDDLHESF